MRPLVASGIRICAILRPAIVTPTLITLTILNAACGGAVKPAALDTKSDQCGTCRMVVSAPKTASQVVAPYQEPIFFDDLGCLDQFLATSPRATGARVFVADHRTGEWIPAESAVFTNMGAPRGAMGSSMVAHASAASRDADGMAAGVAVSVATALPALAKTGGMK